MAKKNHIIRDFELRGVIIKLPGEYSHIGVKEKTDINPQDVLTDEFRVHVVSFEFTNVPPEEEIIYALEVKFDFDQIIRAKAAGEDLRLGVNHLFDPKEWVDKTHEAIKQGLDSNEWLGSFTVFINGTRDPMVGWGP